MDIILENVGKRYINEWVFREVHAEIKSGSNWAIVGPNGSGKSTLLQIISGYRIPTTGSVVYKDSTSIIPGEAVFEHVNFASPYLELIEEFTMQEVISFHFQNRKTIYSTIEIAESFELGKYLKKSVKYFSSGMKQRLKLALAFSTKGQLLLLDEPFSNLDSKGIALFYTNLEKMWSKGILIIASNDSREYKMCDNKIEMEHYKKKYHLL